MEESLGMILFSAAPSVVGFLWGGAGETSIVSGTQSANSCLDRFGEMASTGDSGDSFPLCGDTEDQCILDRI